MKEPTQTSNEKRVRRRKRSTSTARRTAIWSVDGTKLLAVIEGEITPDDIAAARALALCLTGNTA
ncbi:hypothetical protein [Nonomuraea endophytica]|uniref:hypothetical protein n=1 Tax=Nonomuraea endophytica TaxID=714136 RepID=UPI0037CBFFB9